MSRDFCPLLINSNKILNGNFLSNLSLCNTTSLFGYAATTYLSPSLLSSLSAQSAQGRSVAGKHRWKGRAYKTWTTSSMKTKRACERTNFWQYYRTAWCGVLPRKCATTRNAHGILVGTGICYIETGGTCR